MVLASAFGDAADQGGGAVGELVEDQDVPGPGGRRVARQRSAGVGDLVAVGTDQRHEAARTRVTRSASAR